MRSMFWLLLLAGLVACQGSASDGAGQPPTHLATPPVDGGDPTVPAASTEPDPAPHGDSATPAAPIIIPGDHLYTPAGSLKRLRGALASLKRQKLVVAHYGDSHSMDGSLARALRATFGGEAPTAPAFITPSHSRRWDGRVKPSGKWARQNWLWKKDEGSFGPMGLAWVTEDPRARWTLELKGDPPPAGSTVAVVYAQERGHLPMALEAGGKVLAKIPSARKPAQGTALGHVEARLPEGVTEVTLRVDCERCPKGASARIFGLQVARPDAPVEWNNFGIISTAARHPFERADETLKDYLGWRDPDLLLVWYGANSVPPRDARFNLERYRERYRGAIRTLRAGAPKASCLLIGPPDMAYFPEKTCFMDREERRLAARRRLPRAMRSRLNERRLERACDPDKLIRRGRRGLLYPAPNVNNDRQWQAYKNTCQPYSPPTLPEIIAIQKEVAAAEGCAYFDTFAAMGGAGTIRQWTCEEEPRASSDLVHMTRRGYDEVAGLLATALGLGAPQTPATPPTRVLTRTPRPEASDAPPKAEADEEFDPDAPIEDGPDEGAPNEDGAEGSDAPDDADEEGAEDGQDGDDPDAPTPPAKDADALPPQKEPAGDDDAQDGP